MAICINGTERTDHQSDVFRTLCRLAACERDGETLEFSFNVALRHYSAVLAVGPSPMMSGELSLAIYNDLKVSQLIHEDDNQTTRELRFFRLTDRGRQLATINSR